ncbi:MAG: bifunctional nuclease family protein [Bacillota bacterium]
MIPVRVKEIAFDAGMNPVLLLIDEEGSRVLPIWIGPFEAHAIALALEGAQPARPLTHDLLKSVCEKLQARVISVTISDVQDGTYFAELRLERNGTETVLDARPSDAVALALRTVAPIFITDKVANYTVAVEDLFRREVAEPDLEQNDPELKKRLH